MRRSARTDWISQAEETIAALPLKARFRNALLAAARDLASDRQVLAAAITGSISRGSPDPKDIDLVVLTRGSRYGTKRRMYHGVSVHMLTRGIERWVRTNLGSRSRPFVLRPPLADAVILWDANARHFAASGDTVPIPLARNDISTIPIARLVSSRHPEEAQRFIDFVTSSRGKSILVGKRYSVSLPTQTKGEKP